MDRSMGLRGLRVSLAALLIIPLLSSAPLTTPAPGAPSSIRDLWSLGTPGELVGTPAVGDIDGDGVMEVAVADATAGALVVGSNGSMLWAFTPPSPPSAGPLLADLDGNGLPDIALVSEDGSVLSLSGERRPLWSFSAGSPIRAPPAAADLNGDGAAEVIVGTEGGEVIAVGPGGRELWRQRAPGPVLLPPLVVSARSPGQLMVVAATSTGALLALSGAGGLIWSRALPSPAASASAAGDLDLDGQPELAVPCADGALRVLSIDGDGIWSCAAGASRSSSPVVADADLDGAPEVLLVSSDGALVCIGPKGAIEWTRRLGATAGPPALYSTGAGRRVAVASGDGTVHVLSGEGERLWSAPAPAVEGSSCVVADPSGAGEALLFVAGESRTLHCLRSGEPAALSWPQLQHDARRTGNMLASSAGALPGAPLWSSSLGSGPLSPPELAEPGGGGGWEVIVASRDGKLHALSALTGLPRWSRAVGSAPGNFPAPLVADVDADGELEAVVAAPDGTIHALRAAGGGELWERGAGARGSCPSAANFDSDAALELALGTSGGELLLLSGADGAPEWVAGLEARVNAAAAIGDLDGDGLPDIAVATQDGALALSGNGSRLWDWPGPGLSASAPALGDIRGDGRLDVVLGTEDGLVTALCGADGRELWSAQIGSPVRAAPVVADVPGGAPQDIIAVAESGEVLALSGESGERIWMVEAGALSSPSAADMDGDGALELFVGTASGLLALGASGRPLWAFSAPGGVSSPPALLDVDRDGSLEVFAAGLDGTLYCLCAGGSCEPGAAPWPSYRHDVRRTGNPCTTGGGFLPDLVLTPSGLRCSELLPNEGAPLTVWVTVRNAGAVASGAFTVALYLDGQPVGSVRREEGLAAAALAVLPFSWAPAGGSHSLRAVADEGNEVPEASEANNEAVRGLRVNFRPVAWAGPDVRARAGAVVSFDGSASSDPDGVIVDYNWSFGDGSHSGGPSPTHRYREAGNYTVVLTVTDDCGAAGSDSLIVSVSAPPRILRWWPEGDVTMSESSECGFRVDAFDPDGDPLETVWLLDGERAGEGPTFTYVPSYSSAGAHALVAEVSDGTGSASHAWRVEVTEAGGPILSWYPAERRVSASTGEILEFCVTLRDPGLRTGWLVDGERVAGALSPSLRLLAGALSPGQHLVAVEVDERGHLDVREWELSVHRLNRPPEFYLLDPPGDSLVLPYGGRQFFTALVRDRDSGAVAVQWYMNGAALPGETSMELLFVHRGERGPLNITVVASDGETSASHSWTVRVNRPPTALLSASKRSLVAGEAVALNASASFDIDGAVAGYSWSFGDGRSCSTAKPAVRHAYSRPGVYVVELTVTDDLGASSTARLTLAVAQDGGGAGVPGPGAALSALALLAALGAARGARSSGVSRRSFTRLRVRRFRGRGPQR